MPARVDWAIPCRYAEQAPDGTATIVGAGTNHITADLPATLGVMIAMKVVVPEAEARDPIVIDVEMAGPDLQPAMPRMEMTLSLGDRSPNLPDGWEEHTSAFVLITWTATVPGTYGLVLTPRDGKGETVDLIVRDAAQ